MVVAPREQHSYSLLISFDLLLLATQLHRQLEYHWKAMYSRNSCSSNMSYRTITEVNTNENLQAKT